MCVNDFELNGKESETRECGKPYRTFEVVNWAKNLMHGESREGFPKLNILARGKCKIFEGRN